MVLSVTDWRGFTMQRYNGRFLIKAIYSEKGSTPGDRIIKLKVQFIETSRLSNRGMNRIKHEGLMRNKTLDCSLEKRETIWHRRKGTHGLNTKGMSGILDTGEIH